MPYMPNLGNAEPLQVEGRPFRDVGVWIKPLQGYDDAAHELVGRIVVAFSHIEIMLGDLALDLAHSGHYIHIPSFRKSFPRQISKKISFIRFCLEHNGPLIGYKKLGLEICDRIENEFNDKRNLYAHSYIRIDLLHSSNEIIFFAIESILDDPDDQHATIFRRNSIRFDVIVDDYKKVRNLYKLTEKCYKYVRKLVPRRR